MVKTSMRKIVLFSIDTSLTLLAGFASLLMRFGLNSKEILDYVPSVLVYTAISSVVYILNGSYSIVWAYASPRDMFILFRGTALAYLVNIVFFYMYKSMILPRSIGVMMFLGSTVLLIMSRLFWQWYTQWYTHFRKKTPSGKRVLIIGAGDAGTTLLEEFERRPELGTVVAFVDDSKRKIGRKIRGIPVYGPVRQTMEVVEKLRVEEVIIAIPSATKDEMQRILNALDMRKVKVRTLPGIYEITDGKARIGQLREVSIEDLLGREQIKVNIKEIGNYIVGKRVLITGAGGSIGSELTRQIARLKPESLILLGKGENSIYNIDEELTRNFPDLVKYRVIGDVSDEIWMKEVFEKYKPQIVFHAAAHKHVHLMEENPYEAFRVNIVGTTTIVDLSCKTGVERVIVISTDKAVNPTSIMGLSKRIAELYSLYKDRNCPTRIAVVRFGNVLGSRGSVVPKFKKQIEEGGPVTVTDPRMKRFFMSIPEAVSLVLQAGAYSKGRDLFVLDMGEQISIDRLARTLITLSGFIPDQDIKIVYTGMRPGEKLYEELFYPYERVENTPHEKVMRVLSNKRFEGVEEIVVKIRYFVKKGDINNALSLARELVPEYGGDFNVVDSERHTRQPGKGEEDIERSREERG